MWRHTQDVELFQRIRNAPARNKTGQGHDNGTHQLASEGNIRYSIYIRESCCENTDEHHAVETAKAMNRERANRIVQATLFKKVAYFSHQGAATGCQNESQAGVVKIQTGSNRDNTAQPPRHRSNKGSRDTR